MTRSTNTSDRAFAVKAQQVRLTKFIVAVVVEARGHAASDPTIAQYLGAWIEPSTWARVGIEIPVTPAKRAARARRR